MHDIQKWTSACLLDQAVDVIRTQAPNLQKLPKNHQSKRPWSCTGYERTMQKCKMYSESQIMLTVWCNWGTASTMASKSCTRFHTAMNLCSWIFRTAKSARVSWAKRIQGYQYIIHCLCMSVLYPCHTRHIHFTIGIPWLSILELINQGSFFSTSGAMYNKVPASAVELASRDKLGWLVMLIRIIYLIYHVFISCSLEQPCSERL